MENKKFIVTLLYDGSKEYYSISDGGLRKVYSHASKKEAQQICDALNSYRSWKTIAKDGNPIKSGEYIITNCVGKCHAANFDWERDEWHHYQEVIAYRSLPEPYKP